MSGSLVEGMLISSCSTAEKSLIQMNLISALSLSFTPSSVLTPFSRFHPAEMSPRNRSTLEQGPLRSQAASPAFGVLREVLFGLCVHDVFCSSLPRHPNVSPTLPCKPSHTSLRISGGNGVI